ncbi:hypothetical protein T4D_12749 [Trichinella pseudospiralis]|uniref:Uncharacterized protein n=1 Tax=Trichinella pseudospiralis TaxID=6337 RepID=A0A0V1FIA5_TRIPS|nr:hypothetical protein T4D_12749 [Trichinella pseudospiralis]
MQVVTINKEFCCIPLSEVILLDEIKVNQKRKTHETITKWMDNNAENPSGDQNLSAFSLCLAFGKQKAVVKSVAAVITYGAATLKCFSLKITF